MTKRSYFKKYTILFLISVLFLCSWFLVSGKTFISRGDGILQHYPALIYYAKYLRSIFHNLFFNHQLVIPNWDFSIGEGSDILTTLHYYVIGDPFSFFSVCIPTRYMHLYYGFIILLRLYLSGIAFSCLCFQRGQKNQYGILAGSMSYVFCYWVLYNITIYPYFLNPLLFLPMLLIGVEKILKKERSYFFIISVFLSALCNFYFFYMLAIITMIYVMVRVLFSYHHSLRLAACHIFKISFASVLGVLMASFIFFPVFYTFLNDARFSANTAVQLFYPLSYYSSLPARFLTSDPSKWMLMGFAAPILPATILLFYKKEEHKILKLFFIICAFIIVFPFFGHALNGFSYVTNRWSWAFALLCSYILSALWNSLMELKQNESILLSLVVFFYFILCLMLEFSRKSNVFIAIIFVVFFLFLLFPMEKKNVFFYKKQQLALLITFVSILTNIFLVYSSSGDNASSNCMDAQEIKGEYLSIDATAIKQVAENIKKFYRYSSKSDFNNGFKTGLSSTSYYWSLSNPYVAQFMKEAEINEGRVHRSRQQKVLCISLSTALALGLVGCGQQGTEQAAEVAEEGQEQAQVLQNILQAQVSPSHSSQSGKEETVYVLADADGSVNQVIVSNWLKNGAGSSELMDSSDLQDIRNVKGFETYERDQGGDLIWQADGSDIYYQGTTDKQVPVTVKVSYQLDGKAVTPEELAGKSGRVTIRLDYDNQETRKVMVGGKEEEIKIPFAMISGMILPQSTFSNIEVKNARLLSEGSNSIVVGVAFPGLRESIDMEGMQDRMSDSEQSEAFRELEIPDYIEVSADTESFELGMTMPRIKINRQVRYLKSGIY